MSNDSHEIGKFGGIATPFLHSSLRNDRCTRGSGLLERGLDELWYQQTGQAPQAAGIQLVRALLLDIKPRRAHAPNEHGMINFVGRLRSWPPRLPAQPIAVEGQCLVQKSSTRMVTIFRRCCMVAPLFTVMGLTQRSLASASSAAERCVRPISNTHTA